MAGTADVLKGVKRYPGVHYPVLVPNLRGLQDLFMLLDANPAEPPLTNEVSVFTAATEAFTRANLNCSIAESLERLSNVTRAALDRGLRVRGYVSVVIACPFSGKTDYKRVQEVAKELMEMGCYEVSLGDTIGKGRPHEVGEMLEEVKKVVPVAKLAVSDPFSRRAVLFTWCRDM
jgi:hydroxymethylglutaryl-CoA lyase